MVIKMRQSEVLKESAELTDSQKETIRKTVMGMIQVNDNLNSCIPEVCPVCGAEHVRFYRRDIHGRKHRSAWIHLIWFPSGRQQNVLMSLFGVPSTIVIIFSAFWKGFPVMKRN
jgi:hypothetical protein